MILLDSSFLVRALVANAPEGTLVETWLARSETLAMSCIAWAEFACGPLSAEQLSLAAVVVSAREPFGPDDAERTATLFNATGRRRRTFADCMIAATALRLDVPLATSNRRDFERFVPHGLRIAPP